MTQSGLSIIGGHESFLDGGVGYRPAFFVYGRLAQLALDAKQQNNRLSETRGENRLISAEWHDLSPTKWRINQGDIFITNQQYGRDPFTAWIDEREARALVEIQQHKGEMSVELPPDGTYWGARVIKIRGSLNRAKKQGTPLYLQRRDTTLE
jgi:hypothetical protein